MIEKLRQLGFGEYEARAYVALLKTGASTGYRAAKEAGIPGAKVYEALARLVERGAVRTVANADGDTSRYVAVPADEVLGGVRARQERILDELSRELRAVAASDDAPDSEWLRGRAPVLGRLNTLLASAVRTVAIAAPTSLDLTVRSAIDRARERGVRIDRVSPPERVGVGEPSEFVAVVDGAVAIVGALGRASDDDGAQALATRSLFLVRFAADYVRLQRALAFAPNVVARLDRQDAWLDWEEAKQRRLLQSLGRIEADTPVSPPN